MTTAELGQLMVLQKLTSLGASNAIVQKEGNRSSITFDAPNGKTYKVTARAKTSGTRQTSTNYAAQCTLDKMTMSFGYLSILVENRILSMSRRYLDQE